MTAPLEARPAALPGVAAKAALAGLFGLVIVALLVALTAALTSWALAAAIWGGGTLFLLMVAAFRPVSTADLVPAARPCADPAEAAERFRLVAALDGPDVLPVCRSRMAAPGKRVARAVIFLHGFSNCPHSARDLVPALEARGAAVLVPRMPWNGPADNGSDCLGKVTGPDLVRWVDAAVDIASGLADEVIVCGISGGGVAAGWALAARAEVTEAVLIAPSHGLASFHPGFSDFLMRLMLTLPAISIWKDPVKRRHVEARDHTMKRQVTTGFAEVMRLGLATLRRARQGAAGSGRLTLVWNEADRAVSEASANRLADAFGRSGTPVTRFLIPATCGLGHEIVDPTDPETNPALVTPLLADYLAGGAAPSCVTRSAWVPMADATSAATTATVRSR
jgi:pimeloyl-ACP methyl ester carboxylesterase